MTAWAMATAGSESRSRERKALRTAISIFVSFHGTTWPLRRITRSEDCAAASRLMRDLARAIEEEALRDDVGVVVDERLLDELVEVASSERRTGVCLRASSREIGGDLAADAARPRRGWRR